MGACHALTSAEKRAETPHRAPAVEEPEPVTRERFPRRARLTRGSDITACWEAGRRRRTTLLELAWRPNLAGHARMGIIVPLFQSSAVARNRLRRRLREILRRDVLPLLQLPPIDVVIRAKRATYAAPFAALRAELTDVVSALT